jgi:hypothetical protein
MNLFPSSNEGKVDTWSVGRSTFYYVYIYKFSSYLTGNKELTAYLPLVLKHREFSLQSASSSGSNLRALYLDGSTWTVPTLWKLWRSFRVILRTHYTRMLGYVRRRCGKAAQIRELNFERISNFIRGKGTGFPSHHSSKRRCSLWDIHEIE